MLISTVYLCLWCLLVEVFIDIQCDIKGHRGLGVVQQKCLVRSKRADEDWREVFVKCCQRLVQFHFEMRLHIVASTRTGEPGGLCSEGRSAAQIKHLPNCRAGSFLSCVKSGRIERITWEHPLDSRWAAASSRQIWNKSLELCFRILNLLVKIYPPVAICVSRCKHCAKLSGGILFEKHLMKHEYSPIHTGWYFWFILKGIACESMVCHDEMSLLLQDQIWIFLCDQIWRLPHHHPSGNLWSKNWN